MSRLQPEPNRTVRTKTGSDTHHGTKQFECACTFLELFASPHLIKSIFVCAHFPILKADDVLILQNSCHDGNRIVPMLALLPFCLFLLRFVCRSGRTGGRTVMGSPAPTLSGMTNNML